jgi:uncharacterized protein
MFQQSSFFVNCRLESKIRTMQITALYTYPIKSLAGIPLQNAALTARGLAYDRRWMLLGHDGRFLTQRELPQMALLQPELTAEGLRIHHRSRQLVPLLLPLPGPEPAPRLDVQVWDDFCPAAPVGEEADGWFSEALQMQCRLVYMPEDVVRPLSPAYGQPGEIVGFADSCPLLVIGEASLAELNSRLASPVPMNRFRPNIVFSGGQAFEEDGWGNFYIGSVPLRGIRPCGRCQVVNIAQETGQPGKEPLRTLSTYRQRGHKILFGLHAAWLPQPGEETARLNLGDVVG